MQSLQKLKVIIVGAGEVGSKVAARLTEYDEVDVTLIERDPQRSIYIQSRINCLHICGSALEPHILRRAGVSTADLFYAVTDSDEVNLIACQLAQEVLRRESARSSAENTSSISESHQSPERVEISEMTLLNPSGLNSSESQPDTQCAPLGEDQECISLTSQSESGRITLFARMRSSALYEHLKHQFPNTNILLPELACSRKIDELIHYQQLFDVIELESETPEPLKLYGVKIHPQSSAVGQALREFTQDLKITVAAIARHVDASNLERSEGPHKHNSKYHTWRQRRELLIPWADYEMKPHDAVYFAASPRSLKKLHHHFCSPDFLGDQPLVIAGENEVARDLFQRVVSRNVRKVDGDLAPRHISMITQSPVETL